MQELELNKYLLAWKNEKSFQEEKLSDIEIQSFMKSASKIEFQFRWTLLFDIVIKSVLLVSVFILITLFIDQSGAVFSNTFLLFLTAFGIYYQTKVYKSLVKISVSEENLKNLLSVFVDFYTGQYFKSVFISALTSTLFFLIGSQYYLYSKYGKIPILKSDDFVVIGLGIILSYGVSIFAYIWQNNNQVRQLKSCLVEIEEETISHASIIRFKRNKLKMIFLTAVVLIIGLLAFLYFITN